MTANAWRAEVEIKLAGVTYLLRPTFAALSRIEEALSCGLMTLARRLSEGMLTLEELHTIISHCLVEGQSTPAKDVLAQGGLGRAAEAVAHMFARVFEDDHEK